MSAPVRLPQARAALVLALALATSAMTAGRSEAQHSVIRPWMPPGSDSLVAAAAEARVSFKANRGDSVTGPNLHAYSVVQAMATKLIASLGPHQLIQGHAVESVLDSLGLDTSVALDPTAPNFLLLMVNNPFQPMAPAIGFLYWYRGTELRSQGAVYRGGHDPRLRVWWTGVSDTPYHSAIVESAHGDSIGWGFTLMALAAGGDTWSALQWPGNGPDLSGAREIQFADINRDGTPELVVWRHAQPESLFTLCSECPQLLTEQTYVEREPGFLLDDSRLMPSPLSTWVLFVRLLHSQNRAGAAKLLTHPAKLDEAIRLGWSTGRKRGLWSLEYTESDPWPRWLALRNQADASHPLYIVHFKQQDARWLIDDWLLEKEPKPGSAHADSVKAAHAAAPTHAPPPAHAPTTRKPGVKP